MKLQTVNREETGRKIRSLIKQKKVKQRQIVEACGLSSTREIRYWYSGERLPSLDALACLADLLEVKMDDLIVKDVEEF